MTSYAMAISLDLSSANAVPWVHAACGAAGVGPATRALDGGSRGA